MGRHFFFFFADCWVLQNSNTLILFLLKTNLVQLQAEDIDDINLICPHDYHPPPPCCRPHLLWASRTLLELSFKSFHLDLCHFTLSFVYWVGGWGGGVGGVGTTEKNPQHSNSSRSRPAITVRMSSAADLSRPSLWTMATADSVGPLVPPSQLPPPLHRPPPRSCLQWAGDGRAHRNRGRNVLHIQPRNVHEQWPSIRWLAMSTWKEPLSSPENIPWEFMPAGTFHLGLPSQVGGNGWKYLNHKRDNYLD